MSDVTQLTPKRLHVQPWDGGVAVDLYGEDGEWFRVYLSQDHADTLLAQVVHRLYGETRTIYSRPL